MKPTCKSWGGGGILLSETVTTTPAPLADITEVKVTKVPTQSEYTPGGIITYIITVTNPTDSFMDNVVLADYLSQITADQVGGGTGAAYDNWDLEIVSTTGIGTVSGTSGLTNQSGDLILTTDIGANGSIVYRLKVKVKITTIGKIIDTIVESNVPEDGSGVKMSSPVLEVVKNVDSSEYTPGGTLTYTVDVDNPGDGTAVGVKVVDDLKNITTQLIDNSTGTAYESWTVTAAVYDISSGTPVPVTDPNDPTYPGFDGTFSGNQSTPNSGFLVDNAAILGSKRRIRYTIVANINSEAKGMIKNVVTVNDDLSSDKGSVTRESKIEVSKTATSQYIAGETITYTITVSNHAVAGVALGVDVRDDFMSIVAPTLSGGAANVFESWTITGLTLVGSETTTTRSTGMNNTDFTNGILTDTVNIYHQMEA